MLKGINLTLMIGSIVPEVVPRVVIESLLSVQVTIASGQRSGFQLVFGMSKTSPLSTRLLPGGYLDPARRVIIVATLNGTPYILMDGVITRQEMAPSNEPEQSKLTITGEDVTRMMDLVDFSGFPYPAMPAEARVAIMIGKYAMYRIVPIIIPSILISVPNPLSLIPGHRGTDLQYIQRLAEIVGYVFHVTPGPRIGTNTAYWGPEIKVGRPQAALIVNSDAASNTETLTLSFDGFAKTLFVILIQEPITKFPIPIPIPDINPLQPLLGRKMPFPFKVSPLGGMSKFNPLEAAVIGIAKAAKSADVVTGSGTIDVTRYGRILKPRELVEVRGAGITYDGLYYVKSCTHNIKAGEYKQSFALSRNALIAN